MALPDQTEIRATQLAAWQQIMALSEQLLHSARRQDWDTLDRLHGEREQALEHFFREALIQDLIPVIQQDINKIREQDSDIVQMVKNNRDELGAESRRLHLMKNRIKEYLSADK